MNMTADSRETMYFNPKGSLKTGLAHFPSEWFNELPLTYFKYIPFDRAQKILPEPMKLVFDRMLKLIVAREGMRLLVDYKVRDLKRGDYGCPLKGWHIDCVTNPRHKSRPERHLIFSTEFGTEYMTTPLEVLAEEEHFSKTVERLTSANSKVAYIQVIPNTITQYERLNLHRGPLITKDCRRVVLRLTQTEVI